MKKLILKTASLFLLLLLVNCQEDTKSFGDLSTPNNLLITSDIQGKTTALPYGDGSGKVKFTATANNAISFKYVFPDGTSSNAPSGILEKRFITPGTHVYTVVVIASGKGGITTTSSIDVEIFSLFKDDEAITFLTGGTQKNWYWAASEPGHLGEGLNSADNTTNYYANEYQSIPFNTNTTCLYDDVMTFSQVGGNLFYELNNNGTSLINREFLSVVGQANSHQYVDACYSYTGAPSVGLKAVTLSPSESLANPTQKRGTVMNFSNNGFMGFYVGQTSYEIMSITANRLVVRTVQEAFTPDGTPHSSAWYQIFTTTPPVQIPPANYTNLVFSDEFNTDGAPDPSKWTYNTGTGGGGWGNGEAQYYTSNPSNIIVSGGTLKITAKKEVLNGSQYTSARIVSDNLYSFKYGKLLIRAKLPSGAGTWPALWMLGQNYATNTWPSCGEIDMMEHVGNQQNTIHGSLHYPGHSGGNADTGSTVIGTASSAFHDYSVVWSATNIDFYVDNVLYHSFSNSASTPFNANFFLILNLAMGGNFGGTIDPNFTQATMEVDYVRVYQ